MRYLFVVQGEGRGHLTQALSLASILRRQGHEVVKVLVGHTRHRQIPEFFLRCACRYVRGATIQFQGRRYTCESRADRCCQYGAP